MFEGQLTGVGDDEADGFAHLGEDFGQAFAVDGARCAGDADDDLAHGSNPVALPFSLLFFLSTFFSHRFRRFQV